MFFVQPGQVFVYEADNDGSFVFKTVLTPSMLSVNHNPILFGYSLAIYNNRILVGAPAQSSNTLMWKLINSGLVYDFVSNDTVWQLSGIINGTTMPGFGWKIALQGRYTLITAAGKLNEPGTSSLYACSKLLLGWICGFNFSDKHWTSISMPPLEVHNWASASLSLVNDVAVVGDPAANNSTGIWCSCID